MALKYNLRDIGYKKKLDNFLALKADITKYFINRFLDKQWPLKYTTTKKH